MVRRDREPLRLEPRDHGVRVLWMDDPSETQNTLKAELVDSFERALDALRADGDARALVFISGKPDSFLAGANLQMLRDVSDVESGSALARLSQGVQRRIEALALSSVAAIHGPCLGGGLELALAFDARVASSDPRTRLGLPEVQLGLLPAGGGTQRLSRLIDIEQALDLLLSGRQLDSAQALRAGLVDETVPPAILLDAAINLALERSLGVPRRRRRRWHHLGAWRSRLLRSTAPGRALLFRQAQRRLQARTRGNYPAPERILQVVRTGLENGFEAGLAAEARAFGELLMSPQAKQLIGLFFASNELKKDPGIAPGAEPAPVRKVGVLGGGLMGSGISYVTVAQAGIPVRLKDRDAAGAAHGLAYVDALLGKRVARRRMSRLQRRQVMARLSATTDYSGFADADVVIEAVFEDLELKRQMLRDVEQAGPGNVIFASNTSALPLTEIASASAHPETVIGMHYFSPVEKMPLLEVVVTAQTAPWVTATCVDLGRRQGKTVIVVNDGVGFYTTRTLVPFMLEAATLVTEGVPVPEIDRALMDFGFPVGPIALLDEVGIDVAQKVAGIARQAFGERLQIPEAFARLSADERLGRKNGRGFYLYGERRRRGPKRVDTSVYRTLGVTPQSSLPAAQIAERCTLAMLNEAVHCLGDGVLRSPRDGDIGAVFGLGFPPFLGGPFRYLDARGAGLVRERLEALYERHGARFAPAPMLAEHAAAGSLFHP